MPPDLSEAAAAEPKKRLRAAIGSELDSLDFRGKKLDSDNPYFEEAGKAELEGTDREGTQPPAGN
ncbi:MULTISPECIES: hypothetical protein [Rhodopirellula]|uniref:hypothetical protein n=1 Tax=Rhodopirellula TaxID=265488 RepID=UPI00257EC430|nr:hypothetical protein [Rhodopirellula sp. UBA1907]